MFLIVFNRGQAQPLVVTRFFCPRSSRGESAEPPRITLHARPRIRPVHGHDQSTHRQRTWPIPLHGIALSSLSLWPSIVHGHGRGLGRTNSKRVHATALAMDPDWPHAGNCIGQSLSNPSLRTRHIRPLRAATGCPRRSLAPVTRRPLKGTTPARTIPAYHYSDIWHLRFRTRWLKVAGIVEWRWAGDNRSADHSRAKDRRGGRGGCAAVDGRAA